MAACTVIVAFYNRIDFLRLVFASLERQTFEDFAVIVADDGSKEDVTREVEVLCQNAPFHARHLWHEDLGFRKNRILNRSIRESTTPYLIFIDGDCLLHRDFVGEHLSARQRGVCLTGRRVNLSRKISSKLTAERIRKGYLEKHTPGILLSGLLGGSSHVGKGIYLRNQFVRRILNSKERGILGCNFSLFTEDMAGINGFDERYERPSVGEDTDVEHRLRLSGVKIRSLNNIAVQYHLYHQEQPRPPENLELFEQIKREGHFFTPYGVEQQG